MSSVLSGKKPHPLPRHIPTIPLSKCLFPNPDSPPSALLTQNTTPSILKRRWYALRNASERQSKDVVEVMVKAAVILHNMIHDYDGKYKKWSAELLSGGDLAGYEDDADVADFSDDEEIRARDEGVPQHFSGLNVLGTFHLEEHDPSTENTREGARLDPTNVQVEDAYHGFRAALVEHHRIVGNDGTRKWLVLPRNIHESQ
jgi:hypothetical protein